MVYSQLCCAADRAFGYVAEVIEREAAAGRVRRTGLLGVEYTLNPAIARAYRDAADAQVVAFDAGLEAGKRPEDLVVLAQNARDALWRSFRFSHKALEGAGWLHTVGRWIVSDAEAARMLEQAGVHVLGWHELRADTLEVELEVEVDEGRERRVVNVPGYEVAVTWEHVVPLRLGRTDRAWSASMAAHELDPTPRWWVREDASWERPRR